MKPHLPASAVLGALAVFGALPSGYSDTSTPIYSIAKTALYVQKSPDSSGLSDRYSYIATAQSQVAATLAFPSNSSSPLAFSGSGTDWEISESFTAKSLMDAAFPNGDYRITGSGIPAISLPLTPESYPSSIPTVTNGTWSSGVLVLNPSSAATLDLSDFSTYDSGGIGGFMELKIVDLSENSSPLAKAEITAANSLGIPQGSTPFTSYSIPAGTLTPGDIYEARLQYATVQDFDTATVPGSGVITFFENELLFYLVAPAGGVAAQPPVIAADLTDQTAIVGGTATFAPSVTVGGSPLSGPGFVTLWYLNGQEINIDGVKYVSQGASLVVNNIGVADAGVYLGKILNDGGLAITANATLTVQQPSAPALTTQPQGQSMNSGSTVVFTVVAPADVSYQWEYTPATAFINGSPTPDWINLTDGNGIAGSTGPQLVIANASGTDAGTYAVVVTNSTGSTTSAHAGLQVAASSAPGLATSISTRAFVGTGDNILIGGFFVVGSTSRTVLIQGLGPALGQFGVTGFLAHPTLSIHQTQNGGDVTLYSNTGWGSNPVLLNAAASVFASPVLPANSPDSELLLTLPPGGYSAEVGGADGGSGVALCAIYELP